LTLWAKEKSLAPTGNETPEVYPAAQQVSKIIQTPYLGYVSISIMMHGNRAPALSNLFRQIISC
jgi:hypothetical protein